MRNRWCVTRICGCSDGVGVAVIVYREKHDPEALSCELGSNYRIADVVARSRCSKCGAKWPQLRSNRVLSCLIDHTDFLALLSQATISRASITYPLDNSELTADSIGWACESACDGPVGSIPPPGQIEPKPETLRCRICATSDLLEDASSSVEQ